MRESDMSRDARLGAHGAVSTSLALYSDRALGELVDAATPLGSGIGGTSALLDVAGTPVFVKRLPLTDLELRPENARSTANLFGVPLNCQFGVGEIGNPGFGAWRELAVHTMTTNWVVSGEFEGFPLMYHWRVLPGTTPLPEEIADIDRAVAYWGGSPRLRDRLEALRRSPATVALFLEYIPHTLHDWLSARVKAGDEAGSAAADRACAMMERELDAGLSFMNDRGLLHFDAHFQNVLTDGRRLYFADYGLALSSRFERTADEAGFFDRYRRYDRWYTSTQMVNWLVTALCGFRVEDREGRYEAVCAFAKGERPTGMPREAAAIITRHAPTAAVVSGFARAFRTGSRQTPYPVDELRLLGDAYGPPIA